MSEDQIEDIDGFRRRARTWIRANLGPMGEVNPALRDRGDEEELAGVARDREVQKMLFDAGLAGICFPREYGGQGLTAAHQRVLNEELAGFEYPVRIQVPTMAPCAAVLLEFGTEEQKRHHLPAILSGEEIWMQFLSEPSGGSDVAGALTSAVRDGDEWVLNGSKLWTTGAWWSDWGLVLARTNWDVPKHRGLTVFIMPITRAGVTVSRIEMVNGNREFCQEFLSDVRISDAERVSEVDDGWTVATRWLFHERMQHNSPFVTRPAGGHGGQAPSMTAIARDAGRLDDPVARDLLGEGLMLDLVTQALNRRMSLGIASGVMSDQAAAVGRLFSCTTTARRTSIAFELADAAGAAWADDDGEIAERGVDFLMRQVPCIGGGTTEMARNVVAERVLAMPREAVLDRDVAFRDVRRGSARSQ
jgi:alkylation response protein AidB-like acyl-CoA dehydrogenase